MAAVPYSGVGGDLEPGAISVPDDYRRASADPAAFGGATAQAMGGLGRSAEQLGGAMLDIAARQKAQEVQVTTTDALNQLQQSGQNRTFGDPNNPADTGFTGLRGRQAVDGYKGFVTGLQNDQQAIADGITDPTARRMFLQQARRMTFGFSESGARHKQQQFQQYQVEANNAAANLSERQALLNYNNDDGFLHGKADVLGATEAALRAAGASDQAVQAGLAAAGDALEKKRILRIAADGSGGVLAAQAYLRNNMDKLLPTTQTALLDHLRPLADKATASTGAQEALGTASPTSPGAIPPEQRGAILSQATAGTNVPPAVLNAVISQESGWDPTKQRPGGTDLGLGQITSSTGADPGFGLAPISRDDARDPVKNATFAARYLEARGKALGLTSADDWRDQSKVSKALLAYNGGGDPNYVQNVMRYMRSAGGGGAPAASGPPDLGEAMDRFNKIADRDGYSFEARRQGEALVHSEISRQAATFHDAQVALVKQAGNVNQALADGRDVQPIDEMQFRRSFPAEKADDMVRAQAEAQQTGWLMQQINFASPQRLQQIGADLDSGTGPISALARARVGKGLATGPDGTAPVDPNNDPEDYTRRRALSAKLTTAIARRNQLLLEDPAGFAMRDPAIADTVQAASQPNASPDQRAAGVQALLDRQAYLGVPEEKRSALPASEVAADVHALQTVDPAEADMGQALQQKAAAYGDTWPEVFGSYVRGGLSPAYQALGVMDRPDQIGDRVEMQRALVTVGEKGGAEALKTAAGKENAKTIEDGLETTMLPLRASFADDQRAINLYGTFRDAVRTLALYKAARGDANALTNAYEGIIGKRFDFDGTMRVPKGMMLDARAATTAAMDGLKAEDLPVVRDSTPGLTDQDKRNQLLRSIRAFGHWVPTPDDSGLQLVSRTNDNTSFAVTKNGAPVVLKFDDIRGKAAGSAAGFADELYRAGVGPQ